MPTITARDWQALGVATCSYDEYRPTMGLPVRIGPTPPRWGPDRRERLTEARALIPGPAELAADLPRFRSTYWRRLDTISPATLYAMLSALPARGDENRVLLCRCDLMTAPWCHRTVLAEWLDHRTGWRPVELGREPRGRPAPEPALW